MSIKLLAQDLYRCRNKVEQLEKELIVVTPEARAPIETALRQAKRELDYLQRALDGRLGR